MKKSATLTVAISAPYAEVFDYVSDPKNLSKWSVNFIEEVIESEEGLRAVTPMGTVPLRIISDSNSGVIDLVFGSGPSIPTRLIPNEDGCDYIFTLYQPPQMPEEAWIHQGIPGLQEELDLLKKIVETNN